MNIVIITSQLPYPLVSGGTQAQFNIVDVLRSKHHFTIVFPSNQKNNQKALRQLQALWPEVSFRPYSYLRQICYPRFLVDKAVRAFKLKFTPNNKRFQVERILKPYGYYCSPDFVAFVNNTVKKTQADLVQIDFYPHLHLVNFLEENTRKVFVQHEIRYVRNLRILAPFKLNAKEQALFMQLKEQEITDLNKFDCVVTLTQVDQQQLANDGVHSPIVVSPAAVNTIVTPFDKWNGKLTFMGSFTHIPNQEGMEWFLNQVLPLVDTSALTAIEVVGSGWPQDYNARHPKVQFVGFVENLSEALHNSIFIVPLLTGSGMRMKILDAAATGAPFVSTTVGAEGLRFQPGHSCLIADTPAAFAQAINRLTHDQALANTLANNALATFREFYSVKALAQVRDTVYHQFQKK